VADIVTAEIDLPTPGATWKSEVRRTAMSAYDVYLRHRWAPNLILDRSGVTPARLRYMEALLGTLREAGFSAAMTDHAYHVLESHIMGYSLWLTEMDLGPPEDLAVMATAFVETLPAGAYPYIVEHVGEHLKPRAPDDEGDYAFGLDLVLDGLERILVAG
jgi:Tetracyclin repressor-like, C-terminal domain